MAAGSSPSLAPPPARERGTGPLAWVATHLPQICAALTALTLIIVVPYRILEGGYLNHVSGTWAALADDFARGVLYRPLLSPEGYGGTRYFPLHFVLHGLVTRLGLSLRLGGHLLELASAALLVAGGALALQKGGASKTTSWCLALLTMASRTPIMGAAGIRGDLLPVALAVMGLGAMPRDERGRVVPAAIWLSLAVLSKPTLVWAPGGAMLALLAARRVRPLVTLGALVGAVVIGGLALTSVASHGQMFPSFRACASGGGVSLAILREGLSYARPADLVWILSGPALTLARGRRALTDPICAAGLVCLPVTVVIYMSRGTHVNHLVDAAALGALAVGAALCDPQLRPRWPRVLLAAGTVLGLAEGILLDGMFLKRGELDEVVSVLPKGPDPILSEQPWIPLLAGERAFALDAYAITLTRQRVPEIGTDLLARLDQCRFRTVVLIGNAAKPETEAWYEQTQFGPGFRQHLLASYALKGVFGGLVVYVPRCGGAAVPTPVNPDAETVMERGGRPSRLHVIMHWLRGR